jgi:hypothetical protein
VPKDVVRIVDNWFTIYAARGCNSSRCFLRHAVALRAPADTRRRTKAQCWASRTRTRTGRSERSRPCPRWPRPSSRRSQRARRATRCCPARRALAVRLSALKGRRTGGLGARRRPQRPLARTRAVVGHLAVRDDACAPVQAAHPLARRAHARRKDELRGNGRRAQAPVTTTSLHDPSHTRWASTKARHPAPRTCAFTSARHSCAARACASSSSGASGSRVFWPVLTAAFRDDG